MKQSPVPDGIHTGDDRGFIEAGGPDHSFGHFFHRKRSCVFDLCQPSLLLFGQPDPESKNAKTFSCMYATHRCFLTTTSSFRLFFPPGEGKYYFQG